MSFIPLLSQTRGDVAAIGVSSIDELFADIPVA